jgi:hypothetical protein
MRCMLDKEGNTRVRTNTHTRPETRKCTQAHASTLACTQREIPNSFCFLIATVVWRTRLNITLYVYWQSFYSIKMLVTGVSIKF